MAMNEFFDAFNSLMLLAQQHGDSSSGTLGFAPGAVGALIAGLLFNRAKTQHPRRASAEDRNREELEHEINVGIECYTRGEYDQAESLLGPAVRRAERIAPCSGDTARAYRVLGLISLCRRGPEEAERLIRQALAIYEPVRWSFDRDVVVCRLDLAWCRMEQGWLKEAEDILRDLLPTLNKKPQPENDLIIFTLYRLSRVRQLRGDLAEGEKLLEDALGLYDKGPWKSDKDLCEILKALAKVRHSRGRYAEAVEAHERLTGVLKESRGPEAPAVAEVLLQTGWMLMEDQSYHRAEMVCREALNLLRETRGWEHAKVGIAWAHLLAVYLRQGRQREAVEAARCELNILKTCEAGPDRDQLAWWLARYVEYLRSWLCYREADQIEYGVVGVSDAYSVLFRPERSWPMGCWN